VTRCDVTRLLASCARTRCSFKQFGKKKKTRGKKNIPQKNAHGGGGRRKRRAGGGRGGGVLEYACTGLALSSLRAPLPSVEKTICTNPRPVYTTSDTRHVDSSSLGNCE
jgi:hypothetical protein